MVTVQLIHPDAPRGRGPLWVTPTPRASAGVLEPVLARMLGVRVRLSAFRRMAAADPILQPLVARTPGLRLPQTPEPFEAAIRAILGQLVSVRAATTMVDRLVRAFGRPAPRAAGRAFYAFPSARALADASLSALRALGCTGNKARFIRSIACATADGEVDWEALRPASAATIYAALRPLPGMGPWTIEYIRMRGLGHRDAFPHGDLGVVRAMLRHGVPADQILRRAEGWRPWRAYAALYLWQPPPGVA